MNSDWETLDGELILPEDGTITTIGSVTYDDDWNFVGNYGFSACPLLTYIYIPKTVTSISMMAFDSCFSLQFIVIPEGVTSISDRAFGHCESLESVAIPHSVTTIGGNAFSWCKSLESVHIPATVTSIGFEAFIGCDSLESITFSGTMAEWNTVDKAWDWNISSSITEIICSDGQVAL